MPHIHYKFSSKLSYDTVVFDGPHITLEELKRRIMGREKLRAADCDLQITNAQNKEEFTEDSGLIPKGSSVIVRRIPISGVKPNSSSKTHNIEQSDVHLHHAFGGSRATRSQPKPHSASPTAPHNIFKMDDQSSTGALSFFSKMQMANLVDADVSEEEKIKFMMYQSAHDSLSLNKKLGTALPVNYTCYRCGNTGHHIRNCPTSGDKNFEAPLRIKKSTGIPRSFMVEVDDPTMKGAMLTNTGRLAIPAIDAEAYANGKKEKPPFIQQEQPKLEKEDDPIPEELLCLICHDLLSDAVVIPCCGNSYCDDCIRTTLLDSEDHDCPTCGQSDVSPDTLIANKFLRQTVNNFKRERNNTKTLRRTSDSSQSQNSTQTPNPVPTPPAVTTQSQLQKPPPLPDSQQDPLLDQPTAANSPPLSRVSGLPSAATSPAPAHGTPSSFLQPVQGHLEISDKEAEGNTQDDSAALVSSVLVSSKDPAEALSEPTPPVNHTAVAEQPQTVSQQPSSADQALRQSGLANSWDSSSSSSGYPPSSLSSSSYPATPPPLFPSPLFHTFLLAHQSHGGYPPGYPPTTPVWTLPTPQGAPIPPLCSSTSASSIPALIPKEWYRYQRKEKERSPHRESSYRRPSSHSNSKPSKSKSSRSYSRSTSRSGSRSRSRSQSKSRPRSPYSRHRDQRTRSSPSGSYSFGYKRSRSPTPSSSSSPRVGYHSRSKSPADHWKNRHHGRKSASSSCSSRRRGERSGREAGGLGGSSTRNLYGEQTKQTSSSQDLDRESYIQWKYKEWYEKYFSSYVGQFPQMPLPFVNLLPPPCPQLEDREGRRNHSHANLDSRYRPQGRQTARMDGRSPSSESSSDSRSPPSQSSSDSLSTPSQSSSASHSSLSCKTNNSRSPPSQSSSDSRSTPRQYPESCSEKHNRSTVTPARNSEGVNPQEHKHKRMKKVEEGRGEDSSSLDAADSTDDSRKGKKRKSCGPSSCKDSTPVKNKETAKDALGSPPLKRDKPLEKDYERKAKEERNSERDKGSRRGKESNSRQKEERQHRVKPSKDPDREGTSRGSTAPDSRSENSGKRKVENLERNEMDSSVSVESESSKCLKTETAEDPETCKSESPQALDRDKQKVEKKKEKKTWPLSETDIWEGGMEVKPQRKISININLGGKRKEEKTDKQDLSCLESFTGKSQENMELTAIREEEKFDEGKIEIDENKKKENTKDQEFLLFDVKPEEGDRRKMWDKADFRDDKGGVWEKTAGRKGGTGEKQDKGEEEDLDLWHCALRGVEERIVGKDEEAERARNDSREEEMAVTSQTEKTESTCNENRGEEDDSARSDSQKSKNKSRHDGFNSTPDDGSSTSVVASCGGKDTQQKWAGMTIVDEYTEERAADVIIQVPRSTWENEGEREQHDGEVGGHAVSPVALPQPSVTNKETGGDNEQQRKRSMERGRDEVMVRRRDREKEESAPLSWSRRGVAPSSGKTRTDSTSVSERERGRQQQSKRSKEQTRVEDRRRDRERDRERSSSALMQSRNLPSSSHSCSTSQNAERKDGRRGCSQSSSSGKFTRNSATSRAAELPDQSAHKSYRDVQLELKCKDQFEYYGNYQEPLENYRHQDKPAGTHPSPTSSSARKERDLLPFESSAGPQRRSPDWGVMQNKSRNDSEVKGGEWKPNKVDKLIRQAKGARENQEMVAGGGRWEDEADELEGEGRPSSRSSSSSSSSSSASQNSNEGKRNERRRKERKHEKERRQEKEEVLLQEKQRGNVEAEWRRGGRRH